MNQGSESKKKKNKSTELSNFYYFNPISRVFKLNIKNYLDNSEESKTHATDYLMRNTQKGYTLK